MIILNTEINLDAARGIYQLFYEKEFQNQLNDINARLLVNNQILIDYSPESESYIHNLWHLRPDHHNNVQQNSGDVHDTIMKIISIIPTDVILKWSGIKSNIINDLNSLKWKIHRLVSDNYFKIHLKTIEYAITNYPELESFITIYYTSIEG